MHFQSVVINVSDLDRSVDFYRDVFGFAELSRKDQLAALYLTGTDRPQVIVLRARGTGRVTGGRHVGIRALVIEADSLDVVEQVAQALDEQGCLVRRHTADTWTAVFGSDPDHLAVVVGCSLTDDPVTLESWAALDEVLYGLGE